jgi:hypothetical protein
LRGARFCISIISIISTYNSAAALLAGGGLRQYNSHKEKGAAAPSFLRAMNSLDKMKPLKKNTAQQRNFFLTGAITENGSSAIKIGLLPKRRTGVLFLWAHITEQTAPELSGAIWK